MSGSGREILSDFREWSRVPTGCPKVDCRPSLMSWSVREVLSNPREW